MRGFYAWDQPLSGFLSVATKKVKRSSCIGVAEYANIVCVL